MMKRLLLGGLLAAAMAFAQGGGGVGEEGMGGMNPRSGGGMGGDMGGDRGPSIRAVPTPMDRIANQFNLNKDQRKQVKSILDDGQKEAMPVRDQMIKSRQAIAQAVAAGKSQDEIDAAIKTYAAAQAQMAQIELRAVAKIFPVLEKDQQARAGALLSLLNGIYKGKNWDAPPTSPN